MDDQQQQRVNQAAEEFANALRESYQTVAGRGESAYELNAQLTEQFFNRVVNNLQTQAEANRQTGEQLAEQAQRGQEASRQLTQESVQAYMDFVNSMFAFSQAGPQAAQSGAQRADGAARG
jgi:endonuclease/exonuclease/phosphatase (EEP) superfamily protein YafD